MIEKELLRPSDAARLVGMTKELFNYYAKNNRVPGEYFMGKYRFFDASVLRDWQPTDRRKVAKRD